MSAVDFCFTANYNLSQEDDAEQRERILAKLKQSPIMPLQLFLAHCRPRYGVGECSCADFEIYIQYIYTVQLYCFGARQYRDWSHHAASIECAVM